MMLATSKIRLDVIKGMPKFNTGLEIEGESVLISRKLDHFSFLATLYLRIPKPIGNSVISVDQFINGKLRQNESHAMEVRCSCPAKAFFSNTDAINTIQPNSSGLSSPTSVLKHAGTFIFFVFTRLLRGTYNVYLLFHVSFYIQMCSRKFSLFGESDNFNIYLENSGHPGH
jgi:hypothetical protein